MKANEQTQQQIERAIRKIAQKFPSDEDTSILTDIHLRASQDSGELLAFDDDDNEITRCVVEEWIDNKDDNFYQEITTLLRNILKRMRNTVDNLGILKPYSCTLENDDRENIAELYVADDETIIIDGDLMEGLDKDLDSFFDKLLKEGKCETHLPPTLLCPAHGISALTILPWFLTRHGYRGRSCHVVPCHSQVCSCSSAPILLLLRCPQNRATTYWCVVYVYCLQTYS